MTINEFACGKKGNELAIEFIRAKIRQNKISDKLKSNIRSKSCEKITHKLQDFLNPLNSNPNSFAKKHKL